MRAALVVRDTFGELTSAPAATCRSALPSTRARRSSRSERGPRSASRWSPATSSTPRRGSSGGSRRTGSSSAKRPTATKDAIEYEPAARWSRRGRSTRRGLDRRRATTARRARPLAGRWSAGPSSSTILRGALGASRRASAPHLVSVFGPAGVGKTTLAPSSAGVAEAGARVVHGRSLPYRESGTYGALAVQVMQLGGVFESDPVRLVPRSCASGSATLLAGPRRRRGQRPPRRPRRASTRAPRPPTAKRSSTRSASSSRRSPATADDPHLRGRPLGGRNLLDLIRAARDGRARPAAPLRDAGPPGTARPARRPGDPGLTGYSALTLGPLGEVDARELTVPAGDSEAADPRPKR